jgi:hypothetical protein
VSAVQTQADTLLTLATAQQFPLFVGPGTRWRGWALAMQGLAAVGAMGQILSRQSESLGLKCVFEVPTFSIPNGLGK